MHRLFIIDVVICITTGVLSLKACPIGLLTNASKPSISSWSKVSLQT